jgi:hypothetical protein
MINQGEHIEHDLKERQYIEDLVQIRSMMERSSRFLLVSGWAGIFAGSYALIGAYLAHYYLGFNPDRLIFTTDQLSHFTQQKWMLVSLALIVLLVSAVTAVMFSLAQAKQKGERIWTPATKHLLEALLIPVTVGGGLMLILFTVDLIGLIPPLMLIFYGLGLYQAGVYSFNEVKLLGLAQLLLGILNTLFVELGLLWWTLGFGGLHVLYGIYIKIRYER